jgi:hypothetical protein
VEDAMREKHERLESNLRLQANLAQVAANHLEMTEREGPETSAEEAAQ